jgi:predicted phosphodiesterase
MSLIEEVLTFFASLWYYLFFKRVAGPLKLQVVSDLHLEHSGLPEYENFQIPVRAEYLVLAGDIGRATQASHVEAYRQFLKRQCDNFKLVFLIGGNNDFKLNTTADGIQTGLRNMRAFARDPIMRGRLIFMENHSYDFDSEGHEVTVLGCTLWAHHRDDQPNADNGDELIKGWGTPGNNKTHDESFEWLKSRVKQIRDDPKNRNRKMVC